MHFQMNNRIIRVFLLLSLSFVTHHIFAQNKKSNSIGSHFDLGLSYYAAIGMRGTSYDSKYYYIIGLDFTRLFSECWGLRSGLDFTCNYMIMNTNKATGQKSSVDIHLKMVTIPVHFLYYVNKFFFLNGGTSLNVILENTKISIGSSFGVGLEHTLKSGLTYSLNPYIRWNGIIVDQYQLLQMGANLRIGYRF